MMQVDGVPNVRVCAEPARAGADVSAQNVLGSLDRDLAAVVDKVGGPFTPVGFYYRTMIRPRRLWPRVRAACCATLAGLGRVDRARRADARFDTEHRHVDVLVVGGGRSGRAAARGRRRRRASACCSSTRTRRLRRGAGFEVLAPGRALGGLRGRARPGRRRQRAATACARTRIVVATGALEQPLVFPGNDLVGVHAPRAARCRLVRDFGAQARASAPSSSPPTRAASTPPRSSQRAGVAGRRDRRPPRARARRDRGRGHAAACSTAVTIDGPRHELRPARRLRRPAARLLAARPGRRARRVRRRRAASSSRPTCRPASRRSAASTGDAGPGVVPPRARRRGEDGLRLRLRGRRPTKDMKRAVAEGFDSIELAKRYTTVTMGPCQGRSATSASIRLYARETGHGRGRRSARRPRGRRGRRSRSACSRAATTSRRSARRCTTATRRPAPR